MSNESHPAASDLADADDRLVEYHGALSAATRLGLTLDLGEPAQSGELNGLGGSASLGSLEQIYLAASRQAPRDTPSRLQWIEQQLQSESPAFPARYLAGWWLTERTHDEQAVLDAWRIQPEIKRELAGTLRSTWLYLSLPMLVATVGLLYFIWRVVPLIEQLRADMQLTPKIDLVAPHMKTEWTHLFAITLPMMALIWTFVGWTNRGCASLTSWFGGKQYARLRRAQIRGRLRAAATQATGDPSTTSPEQLEIMIDRLLDSRRSSPTTSSPSRFAIQNAGSIVAQQQQSSLETLAALRLIAPSFLVVIVGGGLVTTYCLVLFWPLIGLIYDMTGPLRETF